MLLYPFLCRVLQTVEWQTPTSAPTLREVPVNFFNRAFSMMAATVSWEIDFPPLLLLRSFNDPCSMIFAFWYLMNLFIWEVGNKLRSKTPWSPSRMNALISCNERSFPYFLRYTFTWSFIHSLNCVVITGMVAENNRKSL